MTGSAKRRKSASGRDPQTGQFEAASPFSDPEIADSCVRAVKAISVLEPLLAGMAVGAEDGDARRAMAFTGAALSLWKRSMLEALAADPDSLVEAKKKRLDAKRLGNIPLSEQQRIQATAQAWLSLPDSLPLGGCAVPLPIERQGGDPP